MDLHLKNDKKVLGGGDVAPRNSYFSPPLGS